jgi:hypothetical protein
MGIVADGSGGRGCSGTWAVEYERSIGLKKVRWCNEVDWKRGRRHRGGIGAFIGHFAVVGSGPGDRRDIRDSLRRPHILEGQACSTAGRARPNSGKLIRCPRKTSSSAMIRHLARSLSTARVCRLAATEAIPADAPEATDGELDVYSLWTCWICLRRGGKILKKLKEHFDGAEIAVQDTSGLFDAGVRSCI